MLVLGCALVIAHTNVSTGRTNIVEGVKGREKLFSDKKIGQKEDDPLNKTKNSHIAILAIKRVKGRGTCQGRHELEVG